MTLLPGQAALAAALLLTATAQNGDMMDDMMDGMASMDSEMVDMVMRMSAERSGACRPPDANLTIHPPGQCSHEDFVHYLQSRKACSCRPRETLVSLQTPDLAHMVMPPVTVVNICQGWCRDMAHPTCMPAETERKEIKLTHFFISSGFECGWGHVQQHKTCTCGCPITAADCSEQQEFRANFCKCVCKEKVPCGERKRWDDETCRCVCVKRLECSTGFGWSDNLCRCLKMMEPTDEENEIPYN